MALVVACTSIICGDTRGRLSILEGGLESEQPN